MTPNTDNHIELPEFTAEETKSSFYEVITNIVNLLNGKLSLGSGKNQTKSGNIAGAYIEVVTPATANTDFTVFHLLGYVPKNYIVTNNKAVARIYLSPAVGPDTKTITLRCADTSVTLTLWIF